MYVIILVGIFPLMSPPTKISEGMCPGIPGGRGVMLVIWCILPVLGGP